MDNYDKKSSTWKDIMYDRICENRRQCGSKCKEELEQHLQSCTNNCRPDFLSYGCQFGNNGRCSHYFIIEDSIDNIDRYNHTLQTFAEEYYDIKSNYDLQLAKKEGRLDEYNQQIDDEYEDYAWNEMRKHLFSW